MLPSTLIQHGPELAALLAERPRKRRCQVSRLLKSADFLS